jgi:hypothetical protein
MLQSDRRVLRRIAEGQLSQNFWNMRLTAAQIQTMPNLVEKGLEEAQVAVDHFLNIGRLPSDLHAHHEHPAAQWPERARDLDNISFETAADHADIQSGDPSWRDRYGWQIE